MIASPHAVGDVIQKRQHGGQHAHARHPVAVLHIGRYVVAHLDALRQQPLLVPAERLDYIAARVMNPDMPVLALRAIARRVSTARRRQKSNSRRCPGVSPHQPSLDITPMTCAPRARSLRSSRHIVPRSRSRALTSRRGSRRPSVPRPSPTDRPRRPDRRP